MGNEGFMSQETSPSLFESFFFFLCGDATVPRTHLSQNALVSS